MSTDEILSQVAAIISDLFGIDADSINMETTRDSVDGWDSLQQVNLIMDIESHFQIHLSESQIARIHGVRELIDIIAEGKDTSVES